MHPKYNPPPSPNPAPSPLKGKGKTDKSNMLNAGEHLSEFGLHDVEVSADDLRALVEELGLGGDEANDLIKGLGSDSSKKPEQPKAPEPAKPTASEETKVESTPVEPAPAAKQEEPAIIESAPEPKEPNEAKESKDTPEPEAKDVKEKVESKELKEAEDKAAVTETAGEKAEVAETVKEGNAELTEPDKEEKAEAPSA